MFRVENLKADALLFYEPKKRRSLTRGGQGMEVDVTLLILNSQCACFSVLTFLLSLISSQTVFIQFLSHELSVHSHCSL